MCIFSRRRREHRTASFLGFPSRRTSNPASGSGRTEMLKLDREQLVSVAALALLLMLCVSVAGGLLQARADAARDVSERREILTRLEARLRTVSTQPNAVAPPAAFLDASTQGLASAQLQSYL